MFKLSDFKKPAILAFLSLILGGFITAAYSQTHIYVNHSYPHQYYPVNNNVIYHYHQHQHYHHHYPHWGPYDLEGSHYHDHDFYINGYNTYYDDEID